MLSHDARFNGGRATDASKTKVASTAVAEASAALAIDIAVASGTAIGVDAAATEPNPASWRVARRFTVGDEAG